MTTALNKKSSALLLEGHQQNSFLHPLWGMQDIEASAKICNRCGACAQACQSYRVLKGEPFSPRGRNQLLRFILQRNFRNDIPQKDILNPAVTCIMCGQCTAACAAFVPTAKHMAAVKRNRGLTCGGFWRGLYLKIFARYPAFFYFFTGLRRQKPTYVNAFYLPSIQAPQSIALISKKYEHIQIIKSGLYLTETALTQNLPPLIKTLDNIKAEYEAVLSPEPLPIIADDIESFRLLKLSAEIDEKYQNLAQNAVFIADIIKPQTINKPSKILIQNNNIFFCDDGAAQKALKLFVCPDGKFLVEFTLGAQSAGLLPYCNIKGGAQIAENIAARLAAQKADLLIVLSSADKKFFNNLLKKYYPYTKVLHITEYFYEN